MTSMLAMSGNSLHCREKRWMYPQRVSLDFYRQFLRSHGFPGCAYMPWKFPTKIFFRSAQLWILVRRIGQEQWKVADNEIVTIHSTGLASKPIILEPQFGVCFPRVFLDVGRWSVPRWEDGVEDVSAKGLRS